jgi:hypothetical protein
MFSATPSWRHLNSPNHANWKANKAQKADLPGDAKAKPGTGESSQKLENS